MNTLWTCVVFLTTAFTSCQEEKKESMDTPVAVTGVSFIHQDVTMVIGNEQTLEYTVFPSNATNPDVYWSSDKPGVVSINLGKLKANTEGTAKITIGTWDGDFKDFCEVTVVVTGIKFKQKQMEIPSHSKISMSNYIEPAAAAVFWSSSDPVVADVDEDGILTTKKGGTTTVTVTTKEGGFSDVCDVTVIPAYWSLAADSSSRSLITGFFIDNPGYFNVGVIGSGQNNFEYWPNAHCLDVVIDAFMRTNDLYYMNYFDKWYNGVPQRNGSASNPSWLNHYYDDMAWNALTLLRVYDVTRNMKWLTTCRVVLDDIKTGYTTGGIPWRKSELFSQVTCSTMPVCILAARLYQLTGNGEDLKLAHALYDWQMATLRNPTNGQVYNGYNANDGGINRTAYTYNQGTFIGGAVELYHITKNISYLNDAVKTADYTITNMCEVNDRLVLRASGDLGDGALFNGIFMRYLAQLILCDALSESDRSRYANFMIHNGESLWIKGTWRRDPGPLTLFGRSWLFPPTTTCTGQSCTNGTSFKSQASGGMLIEALALLERNYLLNN